MSASLISLRGVHKRFATPSGDFTALVDVSLEVEAGSLVAVVGKSGSGKSTLLNMIAGIDRPTAGEIWIDSTAVHQLGDNDLARYRGAQVGIIFQFFQLLPTLTVVENVILAMDLVGRVAAAGRRLRALDLLDRVGVVDQANKLPSALSGGQQQRVAIARALANDPPLIIADEPTGNLDSQAADLVLGLLGGLAEAGKTVLLVTHERDIGARLQRTVTLVDGRVAGDEERGLSCTT